MKIPKPILILEPILIPELKLIPEPIPEPIPETDFWPTMKNRFYKNS